MVLYLNGEFLAADRARISVWDGGFLYGDGVFTTLRLYSGFPLDLPAHWRRISDQSAALDLRPPIDRPALEQIIRRLARENGLEQGDGRIRITLSRGGDPADPLPLTDLDRLEPTLLVTLTPLPTTQEAWQRDGICVVTLDHTFARGNIPELKTLNTLPSILAQRRAARTGCSEAILTGDDGRLLEGATSNVFLVSQGRVLTPAAGAGFLAGLTREKVLLLARDAGLTAAEAPLDREDLAQAEEVFLCGSVKEVVPVVAIDGRGVGDGRPGPVTREIQDRYRRQIVARLVEAESKKNGD